MIISLSRIWAIFKKEFIQLKRDRTTLAMIVGIPIMQLILFGYAINSDPRNLPTAVLSQDHSIMARSILAGLKNTEYFSIQQELHSEAEGRLLLQEGKVTFVVTIPENFTRDLIRGDIPALSIEADATDPIAITSALGTVNTALDQVLQREMKGALAYLKPTPSPFELRIHRMYNPEGFSRYNIVPGLIGIVLTMTGMMMTALSLTRERERGTMENLLSMPIKPIEVMAGKIGPYIMIGFIQSTIIISAAVFLFNVPILGSIPLLLFALLIFILCNLALGFVLSTRAQNQMQAMQMSVFLLLPSILLSGFMFPFRGMPEWAQVLGSVLPATYFIRIVRGIMLKGSSFLEIWPNLWPLLIFMSIATLVAVKLYRRTLD